MTENINEFMSSNFVSLFRDESDRACGILGGALLDNHLESLLRKYLLKDDCKKEKLFLPHQTFGSFSAKIEIAYFLALLSKSETRELRLIKDIRNKFAHKIEENIVFNESPIRDKANELHYPPLLLDVAGSRVCGVDIVSIPDQEVQSIKESSRRRFEVSVALMSWLLFEKTKVVTSLAPINGLFDVIKDTKGHYTAPSLSETTR